MSRYAVFVRVVLHAESVKEARENVEAELEDLNFETADIQNVKVVEDEDEEPDEGEPDEALDFG